jgi:hypothetical protein
MLFKTVMAGAVALLAGIATGNALGASGTALGVDPQAEASTAGTARVLTVGADVFIGDNVTTGAKGLVQIKFSDKTELVVGPNSSLVIEDYLLRDDQSAGKFAINALAGTFRFATGGAPKDKYIIKTPSGTIGVRGTAFDFNVIGKETEALLFHGSLIMCNLDKKCVTLDGTCEIGTYNGTDAKLVGPTADITGEQRRSFKEAFDYAENQSSLMREFWFTQARQCFNQGFVNTTQPSLLQGDSNNDSPPDEEPCDCDCGGDIYYNQTYGEGEGGCDE